MRNVIVTGASGLIGSRVTLELAQAGYSVIPTAREPHPKLAEELGMPVEQLDVLAIESHSLHDKSADCLIHCATANDIVSKNAPRGFELSVNGTWNVLELARTLGISRVIYFSTFQVYGTELSGVVDEARSVNCESAYGLNHWFGEEVCRLFALKYAMPIAVVRPSNVYGAPVASTVHRETLVPACFVKAAMEQGEIVLHSSGLQCRNFVSTLEVARACIHLLQDFPKGFDIFNICSAFNASILDIANLTGTIYEKRFGKPLPIRTLSTKPEIGNAFVANSKLRGLWNSSDESLRLMGLEIDRLLEQMVEQAALITT